MSAKSQREVDALHGAFGATNLARSSHGLLAHDIGNVAPNVEDFSEEAFNH